MRVIRAKLVRKCLKFFKLVFGIAAPYNIILDGNFIFTAIKLKIDIRDRLTKLLQGGDIKLYVLKSILKEFDLVGSKAINAKEFAQKFCEILDDEKISGETSSERLIYFLGGVKRDDIITVSTKRNTGKYLVATQDQDLRRTLAHIPGIPLIYLNKVTLILESPSQSSYEYNKEVEQTKTILNEEESSIVKNLSLPKNLKRKLNEVDPVDNTNPTTTSALKLNPKEFADGAAIVSRKKHKAKAPNPLSNIKPLDDSKNTIKKKIKKFRKFY